MKKHYTSMADPAGYLGTRPDLPDGAESRFFLAAACIFPLGMLAHLSYSY